MKKKLMGLFIFLICLVSVGQVLAETVDTTAPQINSISISKTEFVPGEDISFVIDASDDISGIRELAISFMRVEDNSEKPNNTFSIVFNREIFNGSYTYTGKVPTYSLPGQYKFYHASVLDTAGNANYYTVFDGDPDKFKLPKVTINSYDGDDDGPILKSLTFDKNKINAKESILVTAEVEDASSMGNVFIVFNHQSYLLTGGADNKYTVSIPFNNPGVYTFFEMQLLDEHENISFYRYNNGETGGTSGNVDLYYTLEKGKYDVTVDGIIDKEAPVLNDILIKNKKVKVPASFNIYVDATDNMDNDLEVQVVVAKNNGTSTSCGECEAYYIGRENNKYVFQIVLGQYESVGKYSIVHVYLTDDSGNKTVYALQESPYNDFEIMKDYYFEVVEDTVADATTSTNSNNFLEIIKNADNNSVISIDTTKNSKIKKEVFDLIKEKSIVINLETSGIQWIFDGKKITNSKDIDVSTTIDFVENVKNVGNWKRKKHKALVIEFKDNGKLPGRALIRIKADYAFRNYIGIRDLNLYYKNGRNFDLISKGMHLTKDNYYEFYINHNSVYFLSNELIDDKYVEEDYSESLGNEDLNKENVNNNNNNVSDDIKEEVTDNIKDDNNVEEDKTENVLDDEKKENDTEINEDEIVDVFDDEEKENVSEDNKDGSVKKTNLNKYIFIIVIVVCLIVITSLLITFRLKKKL